MISEERFNLSADEPIQIDEQVDAVEAFERSLVEEGRLPSRRTLPIWRLRVPLELVGAVVLALNVAVVAILASFIVFNVVLHSGR